MNAQEARAARVCSRPAGYTVESKTGSWPPEGHAFARRPNAREALLALRRGDEAAAAAAVEADRAAAEADRATRAARRALGRPLSSFPLETARGKLWAEAQREYVARLLDLFGDVPVEDWHMSKSCMLPLVRVGDARVGSNFEDWVVFMPRRRWESRRAGSHAAGLVAEMDRHPSFVRWAPTDGEVLLAGGRDAVEALVADGLLERRA